MNDTVHSTRIRVWDLPVRLFHWSVVALMPLAWLTAEEGDWVTQTLLPALGLQGEAIDWHARIGYTLLALVLFRIGWGFWGSETARFHHFLRGPKATLSHLKHLALRQHHPAPGHNPAGGWMVVLLLAMLAVQAITGLFSNDDVAFEGPLAAWVGEDLSEAIGEFHHEHFEVMLVFVFAHIAAVVFYKIWANDALVPPMITGWRDLPANTPVPQMQRPLIAWFWMAVVAALAWLCLF